MAAGRVSIDDAAVKEYMRLPDGPVYRHLQIVARGIQLRARASLKSGFPQDWLSPKIVIRTVMLNDGPHVQVGADETHTLPHLIIGNPFLAFTGRDGRRVVLDARRGQIVNHPGSNMAPYLADKLLEALSTTKEVAL